jgi:hypothetical protein
MAPFWVSARFGGKLNYQIITSLYGPARRKSIIGEVSTGANRGMYVPQVHKPLFLSVNPAPPHSDLCTILYQ